MMPRRTLPAAAILLALPLLGPATPADGVPQPGPTLTAQPLHPLQGLRSTLTADMQRPHGRPTTLQRLTDGRWRAVASHPSRTADGTASYTVTVFRPTRYRIVARAVGDRPAVVSGIRTVQPTPRAELVSVTPFGRAGNGRSTGSSISGDGRYVVFSSTSTDLVTGITGLDPESEQVYLRDRVARTTTLISHVAGQPTMAVPGVSNAPEISRDGRYVAFASTSNLLVAGDSNIYQDIFRWDRTTGETVMLTEAMGGGGTDGSSLVPTISADGGVVAYFSDAANIVAGDANGTGDVFAWRAADDASLLVSIDTGGDSGDGSSGDTGYVSANGRYVAFTSSATDLVADDTNGHDDVFRRDLQAASTELVSEGHDAPAAGDSVAGAISTNGRYVTFRSTADNLVAGGSINNGTSHGFLRDMTRTTLLVTRSRVGRQLNGGVLPSWVADDGRRVAYSSYATNVVPREDESGLAYLWLRGDARSTTLLRDQFWTQPNARVDEPFISGDLRWVVFYSPATDWVPSDRTSRSDVYVYRR